MHILNLHQLGKQALFALRHKPIDVILIVFISIAMLITANLYFNVNTDDAHWEQFKITHDCKLLTNQSGVQRSSWQCNDGQRYFRWRQQR